MAPFYDVSYCYIVLFAGIVVASCCACDGISPASSKPLRAAMTAMNSLMIAAAAIVPWTIWTSCGCEASVVQMMPVKTRNTPLCGRSVRPRYFCTVTGRRVALAPKRAPKYFPIALAAI